MTTHKFSKIVAAMLTFLLLFGSVLGVSAAEEEYLVLGGTLFGVELDLAGVLVTDIAPFVSSGTETSPAAEAGIAAGDLICEVSGEEVVSLSKLGDAIKSSEGAPLSVGVLREDRKVFVVLQAKKSDETGAWQIGIWAKERLSGIGTLTYYNEKTGKFGGLGHGVCDTSGESLFPVETGKALPARLKSVVRGKSGAPGELVASFEKGELGSISKNTECGVFGSFANPSSGKRVAVAPKDQVREGAATLVCTVTGQGVCSYDVQISEIKQDDSKTKNFIVTVTDEDLLNATGGIVQGMSGSPLLQDGKLIGALTHVLVRHPTRGYGIFIENMLDAA